MGVLFEDEKPQPEKRKKTFYKIYHKDIDNGLFVGMSKPELLTYFVLRRFENEGGECWPGFGTLERLTGLHPRMIDKALKGLETKKIIKVERAKGKVNRYKLLPYT